MRCNATMVTRFLCAALVASGIATVRAQPVLSETPPLCASCHGTHGEGGPNGVPRLAGQNADYMSHALAMFKAGTRASPVMQPIASALADVEIASLAAYFSKQIAPPPRPSPVSELTMAGKRLAETGAANVAACFSCHGAQGAGNGARFPGIASQPAQFTLDRLHEFQARARASTAQPGTMTAVASTMDQRQIEEVAAYLSHLAMHQ
jgi:cytochrome c553